MRLSIGDRPFWVDTQIWTAPAGVPVTIVHSQDDGIPAAPYSAVTAGD
jgi:hypothetical protein